MPEHNRVRYELLRHFGSFVTESSEHLAEYVPWFIKRGRPELIEHFNIPLDEYPRRCEAYLADQRLRDGRAVHVQCERPEHPRRRAADRQPPRRLLRRGAVRRLRARDRAQAVGPLPRHLAALMATNVNVQGLTVEAALSGRREPVYHAAMLDPHTAAELPLEEISRLVDALLDAHGDWIPPLA